MIGAAVAVAVVLGIAGIVDRLPGAEAAGRRPQPERRLQAAEAEEAGQEDGQLAALRLRPGPHPLPAGEGRQAALPQALALQGAAAARVPAGPRRRPALPRQQQRLRDRPRRRHRASSSGSGGSAASTPPRRPTTGDRLYIVNLVPGHVVKLDAKTGKTIWKRSLPGRAESSPLVIGRTRLLRLRRRPPLLAQHPQRERALVDPARRRDQVGARLLRRHPLRRRLRRRHERRRRQDRAR